MKYQVTITIKEDLDKIYNCLVTEINERERSTLNIKKHKDHITVDIHAKDATALKATLHSITQMLQIYEKIKNGNP
jgi:tRNA threonylcarbamoyladenosine modification (KEOPS) complex  Pcc1 subunit